MVVFPVSFWFFLGVSGQLAFTKTHCRMIVYGFLRLIENASWWMSNLLERIYRNSGHPDAIQGIDCANFFNSKKHILQIPMQYIYLYIFFLALQISSKKICKKKNTHLCWIWLSLVRPSVQAGRTGWDGSSPPLPPPSRRHSESRHKSLQRWCRHLEPRESINPVDEPEDAKAGDVFFFSFLFFFT